MLVSYKWLQQYVDLQGVTAKELAEKITRAGIEVDVVSSRNKGIQGVVVGHVLERKQHPDADKLSVCQVDLGEGEPVQIVCGAPNVAAGQKVPVAKVGAVLPDNFKIKKAKLRGEVSEGMICSAQELGVEERFVPAEFKEGIMVLPAHTEVGSDALALLDLDDEVLELDLTPNRSDCLSMLGVAYEVAAILGVEVKLPEFKSTSAESLPQLKVDLNAGDACPFYAAQKVKNIKIKPSPLWLQNRLVAAGIRPINNVVDITNYVMLEYGQPLHAFDAKQVANEHIMVRLAGDGERVTTLDDQERVIPTNAILITDADKTIAIGGVMGAANSEVNASTTEVILESAYFDGYSVRVTSRDLGLRSEASARFEKGVDPERIIPALERAASLLVELAEGEIASDISIAQSKEFKRHNIPVNLARLNKLLGTALKPESVLSILKRLHLEVENKGHELHVEIPGRRQDLRLEEDIFEEVARLYGYDLIPTSLPKGVTTPGKRTDKQQLRQKLKQILRSVGLNQVITYSLTKEEYSRWPSYLAQSFEPVSLIMPMSEERSVLRTTLVPHLLEVAGYNKNRKNTDTHIFEIGQVYLTNEQRLTTLPNEEERVAALIMGTWQQHPWQQVKVEVDFFILKGILEEIFNKLEIQATFNKLELEHFHPGRTAEIIVNNRRIGFIGQIHPLTQKSFDLNQAIVFELSVDALLVNQAPEISFKELPKYPGIQRDLALVVNREVEAGQVMQTIKEAAGKLLQRVSLFDVYQGENVAATKKSLAFSLVYLDPQQTLTDERVKELQDKVMVAVQEQWGAELRQ